MIPTAPDPAVAPAGAVSVFLRFGHQMLRLFFRFIGLVVLAAAFAALVVDGTRSVAAGAPDLLPLGTTAKTLFPSGFAAFQKLVETKAPTLWNPVLVTVMAMPAWLVLGVLGLLLFALTRKRTPKIGYSRR